jgi:trk system potassium uptake protein TrkA
MKNKTGRQSARKVQDVAVIGLSQFGANLARRLEALGHSVLGIDSDASRARTLSPDITETLILDATNESALDEADINSYSTVVVSIANDFEASALVTAALQSRGIPEVICVATDKRHRDILLHIGANRVVLPMEESGLRLADELIASGTGSAMAVGAGYSLIQAQVAVDSPVHTVAECEAKGVSVLALLHEEDMVLAPQPEQALQPGDVLVVMGRAEQVAKFASLV